MPPWTGWMGHWVQAWISSLGGGRGKGTLRHRGSAAALCHSPPPSRRCRGRRPTAAAVVRQEAVYHALLEMAKIHKELVCDETSKVHVPLWTCCVRRACVSRCALGCRPVPACRLLPPDPRSPRGPLNPMFAQACGIPRLCCNSPPGRARRKDRPRRCAVSSEKCTAFRSTDHGLEKQLQGDGQFNVMTELAQLS